MDLFDGLAGDDLAGDGNPCTIETCVLCVTESDGFDSGGDRIEVSYPGPAGEDPAYWSPDAETIASYQKADLILLNGASYAK